MLCHVQPLSHSVDFHGCPVVSVTVTVDLSHHDSDTISSSEDPCVPRVAVRRDQVSTSSLKDL